MFSGYLRLMVMKSLSSKKLSGYGLIKEIERETGSWKPSFGSIYPLLERLRRNRLVQYDVQGRKKVYYLTKEGRKQLPLIVKGKNEIVDRMMGAWNAFSRIIDAKDRAFMLEVFTSMKQGQLPFREINPELSQFRGTVFNVYKKGKDRKKIRAILRKTVKELNSL